MTADTTPTTALDLDAIRYRLAEATPGPWGVGNGTHIVRGLEVTGRGSFTCIQSVAEIDDEDDRLDWGHDDEVEVDPEADAQFIAHARQDIPALLAEVDRLRAELAATPGQAEPLTADVDLAGWASQVADAHRYYEAPHPGDDRDRGLVEWVVMALGNPEQEGAREVLAVLAARHHDELTPTGTAAWLKSLVAELTAERDRVRAERDDDRAEMQELRAELAEAHAQCRRLNRELDDVRAAAEAVAR